MSKSNAVPRGIRNNNPLNIRVGQNWRGEMAEADKTPEQAAETAFEVFDTMADGIRAGAIILSKYQTKYGLKSVADLINRWAPPSENNTRAYAAHVARALGVAPTAPINLFIPETAQAVIRAMCVMECGSAPTDADITAGLALAGIA